MTAFRVFVFIASNEEYLEKFVSITMIDSLDLIFSNEPKDELKILLLNTRKRQIKLKSLSHFLHFIIYIDRYPYEVKVKNINFLFT